tara:strand:+ start:726 stop:980 length:255 start_codon:yes stop_codon:yes gene_type:complete
MAFVYFIDTLIEFTLNIMKPLTKDQKTAIDEFELDGLNSMFICGNLTVKEQQLFLYIIRGANLEDHYDLSKMINYFEMEGLLRM